MVTVFACICSFVLGMYAYDRFLNFVDRLPTHVDDDHAYGDIPRMGRE